MDNVNKQVVEYFKSIGFTLIEIKSSVFRIEESTLVFQTDHKNHTVDASTILYKDAEKIYQDRDQAYTGLIEGIEERIKTLEELYIQELQLSIEEIIKPLYGKE